MKIFGTNISPVPKTASRGSTPQQFSYGLTRIGSHSGSASSELQLEKKVSQSIRNGKNEIFINVAFIFFAKGKIKFHFLWKTCYKKKYVMEINIP